MDHKKMAEYAYENIPFYQKLREQPVTDWEQYPVIDKKMIVDKQNMLFAPEYIGDLYANRLQKVLTSGSSGDCLEIYWKRGDSMKSLTSLWMKRKNTMESFPVTVDVISLQPRLWAVRKLKWKKRSMDWDFARRICLQKNC